MICRKCGCLLESGAKVCSFCGEPLAPSGEDLVTRALGDDGGGAYRAALPPLVPLREVAPVPETREETLAALGRLQSYFDEIDGKYKVLDDLWLVASRGREPSLFRWTAAGGIVAVLFYALIGVHLPHAFSSLFFIVWGVTTVWGYVRSGRRYEKRRARLEYDIRVTENAIRTHFNAAEGCFLPLDYTHPDALAELIEEIDSGLSPSFEDYRFDRTALCRPMEERVAQEKTASAQVPKPSSK